MAIHLCEGKGVFMDSYEINKDTCAIVSINDEITKVLEKNDELWKYM